MRRLIRSRALYPGVPYAYAAIAPSGEPVFTAGGVPVDLSGTVTAPGGTPSQIRLALANLRTVLRAWTVGKPLSSITAACAPSLRASPSPRTVTGKASEGPFFKP